MPTGLTDFEEEVLRLFASGCRTDKEVAGKLGKSDNNVAQARRNMSVKISKIAEDANILIELGMLRVIEGKIYIRSTDAERLYRIQDER